MNILRSHCGLAFVFVFSRLVKSALPFILLTFWITTLSPWLIAQSGSGSGVVENLIVYQRSFCEETIETGNNYSIPCIDLFIKGQRFKFLINPGKYYSTARPQVTSHFTSTPVDGVIQSLNGVDVTVNFYRPPTMRLGEGGHALKSAMPVAEYVTEGYSHYFQVDGVLGAQDMAGLVWDIDFKNKRLTVLKEFTDSEDPFKVKCHIHYPPSGQKQAPYVQAEVARMPLNMTLELQEAEIIQINKEAYSTLKERGVLTECESPRRKDVTATPEGLSVSIQPGDYIPYQHTIAGIKFGSSYTAAPDYRYVFFKPAADWPPYLYYYDFEISTGYKPHFGLSFFAYNNRVVFDLKQKLLLIEPNELVYDSFSESFWLRSGIQPDADTP